MEGLAVSSLEHIEEYLDAQIRSVCQGLPSCLKYIGYERCTTQEEYEEITRVRGNRRTFDLANSSVFLVKFYFIFTDQMGKEHPLTKYINLLYVTDAGILSISGSKYHIVPVISDKVFTPSSESVFVRLTQDRNNMYRMYNTIVMNGHRETRYVIWAIIYRSPEARKTGSTAKRPRTLLTHYLFGKYGFTGAFQRYTGTVPIYGYDNDITPEKYPEKDWIICQTSYGGQRRPVTCFDKFYAPSTIRLAVKRSDWSATMESLVFGFFYVVDHFPERFEPKRQFHDVIDADGVVTREEVIRTEEERRRALISYLDDKALWVILIGVIIFGQHRGENALYKDISEHFESLDAYLDVVAQQKLVEKGVSLENYYDLLNYISVNFNKMIQEGAEVGLNVYGKNLEVLSYVLYDILYGFTTMKFALNKTANRRQLSHKDITSSFQNHAKPGEIFKIHSGKIITKAVSYSGDHMYPGITAVVAEQENRAGAARGQSNRTVVGPQHRIDLSMVTVGSVLNLPKSNPTPVARINPWVTLDERTGTLIENPKFTKLIADNRPLFKI